MILNECIVVFLVVGCYGYGVLCEIGIVDVLWWLVLMLLILWLVVEVGVWDEVLKVVDEVDVDYLIGDFMFELFIFEYVWVICVGVNYFD